MELWLTKRKIQATLTASAVIFAALVCFGLRVGKAEAADHYVRADASGVNNGSDWINAWTSLPESLIRGDTYYIADGGYSSYIFDDVVNGEQLITIKKAVDADHGTDTGWQSSYGDGQAEFGPLSFTTLFWLFDGQMRLTDKSGHGFFIDTGEAVDPSNKGIRLNGSGDIVIRYVEIAGHGPDDDGGGNDLIYASLPVSNVTFQYCYFHDAGRAHLVSRGGENWILERSVMYRNESVSAEHAESWSPGTTSGVTVRYNLFEESGGTGVIATLDNNPGPDDWSIYGNVFLNNISSNGVITTDSESSWTNVKVNNNSFIGGTSYAQGIQIDNGDTSGWQVYNNIWYGNNGSVNFSTPHDYNWFYPAIGDGGDVGEVNGQTGSGNPFVDYLGYDFHLLSATAAGIILQNPFNTDPSSITRGSDGVWDRGAFEFVSGETDTTPPGSPVGLAVQ